MYSKVGLAVSACMLVATAQAAENSNEDSPLDEVVISATRGPGIPRGLLGSSVSLVDAQDMEARQVRVVSDVLRDLPGVAVSRLGAVGGSTQVRIRGAEGNHTLVLVDGIKASDPFAGEFDFATLIADEVARVEVLRGQQSSLYGSDAIGGVVQYTTLTGREAPGFRARLEGGSFGSYDASARFGDAAGSTDYAISVGWQKTDGYPTAREGTRDVGAENLAVSGRLNFDLSDVLRIRTVLRANRTEAETNDEDYDTDTAAFGVIDGNGQFTNKTLLGSVRAEYEALDGRLLSAVQVQHLDARRSGEDAFGAYGDEGKRTRASLESTLRFGDVAAIEHLLTFAVDYEKEQSANTGPFSAADNQSTDDVGVVAQYSLLAGKRLGLGASIRQDDNDRFENATTYRLQGSYLFEAGMRLRAAAGSGVKNPSLTELFGFYLDGFVGNPGLKPEKSSGWEVGIDQQLLNGEVLLGATYFDSELKNEIYTVFGGPPDFSSSPANRATLSKQSGIELSAEARITRGWRISAAWTHLDAKENGVTEVRRPSTTASLNLDWRAPDDGFGANLALRHNGRMFDSNFFGVGPSPVALDAYTLMNLGMDWKFSERIQVYGRIENLLDENYEEIYTYATPGRAAYLGVRMKF